MYCADNSYLDNEPYWFELKPHRDSRLNEPVKAVRSRSPFASRQRSHQYTYQPLQPTTYTGPMPPQMYQVGLQNMHVGYVGCSGVTAVPHTGIPSSYYTPQPQLSGYPSNHQLLQQQSSWQIGPQSQPTLPQSPRPGPPHVVTTSHCYPSGQMTGVSYDPKAMSFYLPEGTTNQSSIPIDGNVTFRQPVNDSMYIQSTQAAGKHAQLNQHPYNTQAQPSTCSQDLYTVLEQSAFSSTPLCVPGTGQCPSLPFSGATSNNYWNSGPASTIGIPQPAPSTTNSSTQPPPHPLIPSSVQQQQSQTSDAPSHEENPLFPTVADVRRHSRHSSGSGSAVFQDPSAQKSKGHQPVTTQPSAVSSSQPQHSPSRRHRRRQQQNQYSTLSTPGIRPPPESSAVNMTTDNYRSSTLPRSKEDSSARSRPLAPRNEKSQQVKYSGFYFIFTKMYIVQKFSSVFNRACGLQTKRRSCLTCLRYSMAGASSRQTRQSARASNTSGYKDVQKKKFRSPK